VNTVAFAPDGSVLAVADDTGVSFHQARDGNETLAFPTYSHRVAAMAFSPDGKRLATGGGAGDAPRGTGVKLWDVVTGRETSALGDPSAVVRSLVFSPDGMRLAAAAGEMSIINNFGQSGGKSVVTIWEAVR
jgi:WD40 repeat protein